MTENSLVSIIITAFNAEKYIEDAIKSVLNQTYKNIEVIVINDGSTDNTETIVESFKDKRVKYFKQKNKGISGAKNAGIRKANGKYITFLDADDLYLPEKVEEELKFLKNNSEFDLVYCNMIHFYEDNPSNFLQHKGPFPSGAIFEELLLRFFGQHNTLLLPKKIFDKIGLFDETLRHSEDWDIQLRIAKDGFSFGFLDKPLVKIRIRKKSLSMLDNQWDMKEHTLKIFKKLFSQMSEKERKKYQANKIFNHLKFKLAIAYLVASRKNDFRKTLKNVSFSFWERKFFTSLIFLSYLLPISLLRFIISKIWLAKQKNIFSSKVIQDDI